METQRESPLEKSINKFARSCGWICKKNVNPGQRGGCDRYYTKFKRKVVWLEIKREGEEPSEQQFRRIDELKAQGHHAYWVDSLEIAQSIFQKHA